MKPVYFLSDAHLGSWAIEHRRMQERRLVRFLDSIKEKAGAVYLWAICSTTGSNSSMSYLAATAVFWEKYRN